MAKIREKHKLKFKENGITLVTLVITIIVLLILAGVTISSIFGDSGIIKNATEAQILSELVNVKEALEIYKITNYAHGDMSNEELVEEGLLKEVFIKDTYRTVAIITDLKAIDIKSKFGKGGEKQKDTEEETLLDMYNVYGIDMSDGTLYYIRDGIWSIEGQKVTYIASGGEEKQGYVVETINQQYLEDRKFITEWTVEAGTTITLPITATPNITIEWGADDDGDGELDIEECTTTQPTHTYTQEGTYTIKISGNMPTWSFRSASTSKDYITRIVQWGNVSYSEINFNSCANLVGNIPSPNIENCFTECKTFDFLFYECTGLTGSIPSDLFDSAINVESFRSCFEKCTGLTGNIPDKLFADKTKCTNVRNCFSGCTNLEGAIPENLFKNCPNVTRMDSIFNGATGITQIPVNLFTNINNGENNVVTNIAGAFYGTQITEVPLGLFDKCTELTTIGNTAYNGGLFSKCKNITTIPEGLFNNCTKIKYMDRLFQGCENLTNLPDDFTIPEGVGDARWLFGGCSNLERLPDNFAIPEGVSTAEGIFHECSNLERLPDNFTLPSTITNVGHMFYDCGVTSLPENFTIPNGVLNMIRTFWGCENLQRLPENFTIPNSVTDMRDTFYGCDNLETLPVNFAIPESVTNASSSIYGTFGGCVKLKGTITIRADLQEYQYFFNGTATQSGETLTVNYTSNCTNIDNIIATGNTNYIKKGSLVD